MPDAVLLGAEEGAEEGAAEDAGAGLDAVRRRFLGGSAGLKNIVVSCVSKAVWATERGFLGGPPESSVECMEEFMSMSLDSGLICSID